jgi:hypothetical protein
VLGDGSQFTGPDGLRSLDRGIEYGSTLRNIAVDFVRSQGWRESAMQSGQHSTANSDLEANDGIDESALASVMRTVPLGAAVLAGSAVALLVLGYLLVYIFVFIPRGAVG